MSFDREITRACVLLIAGLAGCSQPTHEQQLQSSQDQIIGEAMALQQCENTNGYGSAQCASQRSTYQHDLAVFKNTYGK
jgi:uncharacterized lipoprotein